MELIYKSEALADIEYWKASGQKAIQKKISALLAEIAEHPTTGTGKPELLKRDLAGCWSRRINDEHRLVYEIDYENNTVNILSMRGHYYKK